ncbi:MAG: hypothetical protein K8T89_23320 [Planctomycetes bacterium]|nr:hypothetical protein [Planctomycetota bacterium]
MISKDDMMALLLNACPSFAPLWQSFLDEWRDEADGLPLYLALADFARHLIDMHANGEIDRLHVVFRAVERLHLEGDEYVREAATIGLLEDLQNLNLHSCTKPEDFVPYLGAESSRCWEEAGRFWNG